MKCKFHQLRLSALQFYIQHYFQNSCICFILEKEEQNKAKSNTKHHHQQKHTTATKEKTQHVSNRNNLPHNHSYQAFWPKNDAMTKNCSSPLAFFIFPWFSKQFKCISTWMIFDAGFVSGFVSADKLF